MTAIRCKDTAFLTADFDNCVNELRANQATFQAPLHVTLSPPAGRVGVPQLRVHDLVVAFDETMTSRTAVVAVLDKYGCHERPQSSEGSPGGTLSSNPRPGLLSVITTQMT